MTAEEHRSRDDLVWLSLIVVGAALLRAWGLASWQWEQDELYTLRDSLDLGASASGAPGIAGRPLYYLVQHLLLTVLPQSPFFLRLPAFLFGIAGIVVVWLLGCRTFGTTAGLIAATLTAVSPWHLYASQFARYWTLVFLLAALLFGVLPRAVDSSRPPALLGALAVLALGALTHPTFLFPALGFVAALYLVGPGGALGVRWPRRNAWLYLWGPFLILTAGGYLALNLSGQAHAIQNWTERGLLASVRLIPAMVQWTPLETAVAAAVSIAFLLSAGPSPDRRWGILAFAGCASTVFLLFVSSFSTGVYADYGISVLPLAFVSTGGALQRVAERLPAAIGRWVTVGATTALVIGAAPGAVSHMSDGSRFDYRSAYEAIRRLAPDRPVMGGIDALHDVYAPEVPVLKPGAGVVRGAGPFWFVASFQRYGLRGASPAAQRWLDRACRRILIARRPRFDYRDHRVELYWCGADSLPKPRP